MDSRPRRLDSAVSVVVAVEGKIQASGAQESDSLDQAREALIVRVSTSCGTVGYAECLYAPRAALAFLTAEPTSAHTRGVADVLVGRDPRDPGLTDELAAATSRMPGAALPQV